MTEEYEKIADECYREYKKLGGLKNRKDYDDDVDVFFDHTMDLFIHGDPIKYDSRKKAIESVQKILKYNDDEMDILFKSVDNVMGYT